MVHWGSVDRFPNVSAPGCSFQGSPEQVPLDGSGRAPCPPVRLQATLPFSRAKCIFARRTLPKGLVTAGRTFLVPSPRTSFFASPNRFADFRKIIEIHFSHLLSIEKSICDAINVRGITCAYWFHSCKGEERSPWREVETFLNGPSNRCPCSGKDFR